MPILETIRCLQREAAWCACAALLALPLVSVAAYPERPIRLVSPFAPGGGTDLVARAIGQRLAESVGQAVVTDNRPGAGGIAGVELVVRAQPDGYTLLLGGPSPLTVAPFLHKKLLYEPLKDLAPVTLMAVAPSILAVHPANPARSAGELLAIARAKPGQLTFSSSGNGGSGHLAGELLKRMTGIDMLHVPYKGTGPATIALLGGEVSLSIAGPLSVLPHVKSGRLRALAITGEQRSTLMPELPALAETVPGYSARVWYSILVPAATPPAIIGALNATINRILHTTEMREHFARDFGEVIASTPDEFAVFLRAETARWGKLIREAGIRAD